MDIVIIAIVLLGSFAAVYFTGRRFGPLGLALGVGALLSPMWAHSVAAVVASDVRTSLPIENIVGVVLVLLPAFFVLLRGPSTHGKIVRILGSICFIVLAIELVLVPLGPVLAVADVIRPAYRVFTDYRVLIVTGGLVFALMDVGLMRSPRHGKDVSKH